MGRKKQEKVLEVEAIENLEEEVVNETEAVEEELASEEEAAPETVEAEAATPHPEEKPKRQSRRGRKNADTPEAQIELATEAMRKSMQDMVAQWEKIQEISGAVSAQLEKVSHIVKPAVHDFVDTQDMIRPENPKSTFVARFTAVASVVAVLFSVVSLSLSQSARQVALNSEATWQANSQLFSNHSPEVANAPFENKLGKRTKFKK